MGECRVEGRGRRVRSIAPSSRGLFRGFPPLFPSRSLEYPLLEIGVLGWTIRPPDSAWSLCEPVLLVSVCSSSPSRATMQLPSRPRRPLGDSSRLLQSAPVSLAAAQLKIPAGSAPLAALAPRLPSRGPASLPQAVPGVSCSASLRQSSTSDYDPAARAAANTSSANPLAPLLSPSSTRSRLPRFPAHSTTSSHYYRSGLVKKFELPPAPAERSSKREHLILALLPILSLEARSRRSLVSSHAR